jgi:hypothetical protein
MSEELQTTTEGKVIASIGGGRSVEFNTRQDALLFSANYGSYASFLVVYRQIYQTEKGSNHNYKQLRSPSNRKQLFQMMQNTRLSDGSTLFDAVRSQQS